MKFALFLFCSLFFLTSCQSTPKHFHSHGVDEFVIDSYKIREGKFSILEMEGEEPSTLPSNAMEEYEETVAEGDVMSITLYHPSRADLVSSVHSINQANGFPLQKGTVRLPDLDPIAIEGLTLLQAQQAIQDKYQEQIRDVEVFLAFKKREIRRVEIAGSAAATQIPVDGKLRLYGALSFAKVAEDANLFKSYVLREEKLLPVDLYRLLKQGDMSQNIVLRGGDKIYIASPKDSPIMITGEVWSPRPLPAPNGFISLREALVSVGGIPFTGDKRYIQVIRGSIVNPKIYTLNWNHILHLPNRSLLLIPGDVVYVAPKPITQWNRFIDQLLPSFGGINAAYSTYKRVGPS